MFFPFKGEEWLTSSMKLQRDRWCVASNCTGAMKMFEGLFKIARSMTNNIAFWKYQVHMFCARCIRPPGLQCAVGRDDPGSGQSDCWQTSAKSKSDFEADFQWLPVRSDHIWTYYLNLDPLDSNRCRTTNYRVWTHGVDDFAWSRILLVVTSAETSTPASCCKPRHSPIDKHSSRTFSKFDKTLLASNRCCGFGHETWTARPSTYGGSSAQHAQNAKVRVTRKLWYSIHLDTYYTYSYRLGDKNS